MSGGRHRVRASKAAEGVIPSKAALALGALVAFLFIVVVSSALAEDGDSGSQPQPTTADLERAIELGGSTPEEPPTDSAAATELPHRDLGRPGAEELLSAVFGNLVEEPTSAFSVLDEADRFYSDHVAVIDISSQNSGFGEDEDQPERALLDSLLPLRAENDDGHKEAVDLTLEQDEGTLQPTNPLVEVSIPSSLEDGIALPESGVEISLPAVPADRNASLTAEGAAFFPNIAEDSDFVVSPTPTGVETQTQLRSADAPRTQTFDVSMPPGATLSATEDGGAMISAKNGKPLVRVAPPTAIDANGDAVPVSLSVDKARITVSVNPADAAYPILVDPYYESAFFWWLNNHTEGTEEWTPASQSADRYSTPVRGAFNEPGLHIYSHPGPITPGSQANWNWHVPRYFSDYQTYGTRPTTYIQQMTLSELHWWIEESKPYQEHPFILMGIWDEDKGWWNSFSTRNGVEGELHPPYTYVMNNAPQPSGGPTLGVKFGGVSMATFENVSRPRHLLVGQASVQISDTDSPEFGYIYNPDKWVNSTPTEPIQYSFSDKGLGIYGVYLNIPSVNGGISQSGGPLGCYGNVNKPCPRVKSGVLQAYDPKVMPQGEHYVQVYAADPIWHWSEAGIGKIKVDHTKPNLALSGTLTEQGKLGTNAAQYTLKYLATDGDHATPVALAPFGGAGTEPGKTQTPSGIASDASGNIYVVDKANNRVEKFDSTGKFLMQFGSSGSGNGQFKEPRGIAVAPNGDLWVVDSGNARVQHFSSAGVYKSQFGSKGTGGGAQFTTPYGIAVSFGVGPLSGTPIVVVSDAGQNRVAVFKEDGYFFGNVMGSSANPSGPAIFGEPSGVAVDANKNLWVADAQNNRVQKFSSENKFLLQFGSKGTGNGQLSGPVFVSAAPSGNILVADGANHRIQEFSTTGTYLRTFGSLGSGNSQLSNPKGIAVLGGTTYISDADNHRIARWSHADFDPQSGAASTQIKMDGTLVEPKHAPGCAARDCEINREWKLNADLYPVGAHTVEVLATDGVGLSTPQTLSIETHGDLTAPDIALSGSMTEQAGLGTTRPSYLLKVNATDPGGAQERKSGVASTVVKVDGNAVDAAAPGCPAGGCAITREWTLDSNSYAVGAHSIQVTATDAAGRSATKSFSITINRDTTAPQLSAPGAFYTAPEGWLEQVSYSYASAASDPNGYGITSLVLKVDGSVIKSASQTCPKGSCSLSLSGSLNMASYSGGAHPAELVATDGAGKTTKKAWTINVNPSGAVPPVEASDTIEALEESVEETPVAPNDEILDPEQMKSGDNPSLMKVGGEIVSEGVPDVTTLGNDASEGMTIEGPQYTLTITPIAMPPVDPTIITEEAAAIAANIAKETDLAIRPQYNGAMQFAQIRDEASPESFSWTMHMGAEQILALTDSSHAEVRYEDGTRAFLISAELAHDATGAAVQTSLSVSGKVLTLNVHHRGKGLVYPVIAGQAYETSYEPGYVAMPPAELAEEGLAEDESGEFIEFEPLSGGEREQLMHWSAGDRGDPLTKKQGKHLLQARKPLGVVAAPPYRLGPSVNTFELYAKVCQSVTCGVWEVEMEGFYVRGPNYVETNKTSDTECHGDVDWYWSLNVGISWPAVRGGHIPDTEKAYKSSGKHITYWCHFEIQAFPIPELGTVDSSKALLNFVYPNGYQSWQLRGWDGNACGCVQN